MFRVKTEAKRQLLLEINWQWRPSGLILKNWNVDIDANREPQNVQKIWAILLGIPMMFSKKEILEAIRDKISKFVALEEEWEQKVDRRCAKVLIRVELRDGLF